MTRLSLCIRNHFPFIIALPLLIIVMTWPSIDYVFDTESFWLPSKSTDAFFKIWDAWYTQELIAGRADFLYTDAQFYPRGMSLAFHQISLPHSLAVALLRAVMPFSNAINLGYLLLLLANAASTYVLLLLNFGDKWISLFGAVVVGIGPHFVLRGLLPDLTLMAFIPWALYFFHRSIDDKRILFAIFAGIAGGASAFISMYMLACTLLTLGIYGCFMAISRWRHREFRLNVAILLFVVFAISMIRVAPMIVDQSSLAEAVGQRAGASVSSDLLTFFLSASNPTVSPFLAKAFGTSPDLRLYGGYLGYTPLLLTFLGLARRSLRRQMFPWLVILAVFMLLRLGDTLIINADLYPNFPMLKPVLDRALPFFFSPFWYTDGWQAVIALSSAVLACYGLSAVVQRLSQRRAAWLITALVALTAFEYYAPLDGRAITNRQLKFIEWLKAEEPDPIRLINLPMGRSNSKFYSFYQAIAGYPTAEGVANRTLAESYSYIEADPLLSKWRRHNALDCMPANANAINEALNELYSAGFTHIVNHRWLPQSFETPIRFLRSEPAYEDDLATIHRLQDMLDGCRHSAFLSTSASGLLESVLPPASIRLSDHVSVLSIHPAAGSNGNMGRFFSRILEYGTRLVPLTVDDAVRSLSQRDDQDSELERRLFQHGILLLAYDPEATAPDLLDVYTGWIVSRFNSCGRVLDAPDLHLMYFARNEILCDLLTADDPLAVRYENGMNLVNALMKFDGKNLELYLLWGRLAQEPHSVSLQIFDQAGEKVHGADTIIPHDSAMDLILDLRSLEPSTYLAKLILYNFETGATVSGVMTGANAYFDRELELARFTVD